MWSRERRYVATKGYETQEMFCAALKQGLLPQVLQIQKLLFPSVLGTKRSKRHRFSKILVQRNKLKISLCIPLQQVDTSKIAADEVAVFAKD